MNILAFAGSNSSTSINRELVKFALKSYTEESIDLIDLNDYAMPIFSVDLEKNGYPDEVHQFLKKIESCDAIICSLAEHNKTYTAAFKNLFDWSSRINAKIFQNKPMFLMATSTGGYGGGNVLNVATTFFPNFGADIREVFSLPNFEENFNFTNGITHPEKLKEFNEKTKSFKSTLI